MGGYDSQKVKAGPIRAIEIHECINFNRPAEVIAKVFQRFPIDFSSEKCIFLIKKVVPESQKNWKQSAKAY
jgi:hypothetical protein